VNFDHAILSGNLKIGRNKPIYKQNFHDSWKFVYSHKYIQAFYLILSKKVQRNNTNQTEIRNFLIIIDIFYYTFNEKNYKTREYIDKF
jgi:hypothetical protein